MLIIQRSISYPDLFDHLLHWIFDVYIAISDELSAEKLTPKHAHPVIMHVTLQPVRHQLLKSARKGCTARKTPSTAAPRCLGGKQAGQGLPAQPPGDRPVFESSPPTAATTMFDVRDAMEVCSGMAGAEADACFLVFGLDGHQTKKWFPIVDKLEMQLQLPYDDAHDADGSNCDANLWGLPLPHPLSEVAALWQHVTNAISRLHGELTRED